jgi:hypothetical protein
MWVPLTLAILAASSSPILRAEVEPGRPDEGSTTRREVPLEALPGRGGESPDPVCAGRPPTKGESGRDPDRRAWTVVAVGRGPGLAFALVPTSKGRAASRLPGE